MTTRRQPCRCTNTAGREYKHIKSYPQLYPDLATHARSHHKQEVSLSLSLTHTHPCIPTCPYTHDSLDKPSAKPGGPEGHPATGSSPSPMPAWPDGCGGQARESSPSPASPPADRRAHGGLALTGGSRGVHQGVMRLTNIPPPQILMQQHAPGPSLLVRKELLSGDTQTGTLGLTRSHPCTLRLPQGTKDLIRAGTPSLALRGTSTSPPGMSPPTKARADFAESPVGGPSPLRLSASHSLMRANRKCCCGSGK